MEALEIDQRIEASSPLALRACVEPEGGLIIAEREESVLTAWLVNFDSKTILDFDAAGRLASIEVVVPITRLARSRIIIPIVTEMVALRLRSLPTERSETIQEPVRLRRDPANNLIEILFRPDAHFERFHALGPNVYVATTDGILEAAYMSL